MRAGQFSDEQIVAVLQEAATCKKTIATLCQEKGISEATFYAWRKKFHGTSTKEVQKLRESEKENARLKSRLKELLAERDLDLENDVLEEALSKSG
jgi:putative transposase